MVTFKYSQLQDIILYIAYYFPILYSHLKLKVLGHYLIRNNADYISHIAIHRYFEVFFSYSFNVYGIHDLWWYDSFRNIHHNAIRTHQLPGFIYLTRHPDILGIHYQYISLISRSNCTYIFKSVILCCINCSNLQSSGNWNLSRYSHPYYFIYVTFLKQLLRRDIICTEADIWRSILINNL